jgi:chromosome segregation ATPase
MRILIERRKLDKAEITLGLLGWQQADFPPEVEAQINAINTVELQQAELSSRSAEILWKIGELKEEQGLMRKEHDELAAGMRLTLHPLMESLAGAGKQIHAHQESIQRFENALADLQAMRESLDAKYESLMAEVPQTLQIKEQILWIGDRRSATEIEKEDLRKQRMRVMMEVRVLNDHITQVSSQIEKTNRMIRESEEEFAANEKEILSKIAALEQERKTAGKHVDKLDRKKTPAYLAIGRCLADYNIEPMNQPDALTVVLAQRETIGGLRQFFEYSLAVSSQVNRSILRVFYVAMILFALAVVAGVVVLCRGAIHF